MVHCVHESHKSLQLRRHSAKLPCFPTTIVSYDFCVEKCCNFSIHSFVEEATYLSDQKSDAFPFFPFFPQRGGGSAEHFAAFSHICSKKWALR